MVNVPGWLAIAVVVLCLSTVAALGWWRAWLDGYDAGSRRVVETLEVKQWGLCDVGGSWVRCARSSAGDLIVVRGMR